MPLLNKWQEELLKDLRKVLNDLQLILEGSGIEQEDREALKHSLQQIDDLFLIVVVGEFNSGKSAVINALLGQGILEVGVTPTTTKIHLLRYGEREERKILNERQLLLTLPIEFLLNLSIVDTPGTNAILREHEIITSRFIPRSDLVLFITSADRPLTESERQFLEHIRMWGKKVVLVINKIDILKSDSERIQIEEFIQKNAQSLLGENPVIFSVSAHLALKAKQSHEAALWEKSRFGSLEQYIQHTLDEMERFRLKLLNPIGVGILLTQKYHEVASSRLQFLKSDFDLIDEIEAQLRLYREDMQYHFTSRMAEVENLLYEMESRGQAFFEETFRLGRVFDLLSKHRIQKEFESQVVGDIPQRIETKVGEIIHWLIDSDLRQWETVSKHLRERTQEHQRKMLGDVEMGRFYHDRQGLLDTILRETRRVIETYDRTREAKAIAESAQTAVATSAALEAGAIGLGALVTTIATTAAADVTGVLMASFMAVIGLFIIPARRRQGRTKLIEKIASVRIQLAQSLQNHFKKEIDRSLERLREIIAPYTRLIRAEHEKITDLQSELQRCSQEMFRLKGILEER